MTDDEVRAAAQKQAEEGFDGFTNYMKKGTVVCILTLLGFTACNFGVEDDTFPAYNGEQYAPTNMGND